MVWQFFQMPYKVQIGGVHMATTLNCQTGDSQKGRQVINYRLPIYKAMLARENRWYTSIYRYLYMHFSYILRITPRIVNGLKLDIILFPFFEIGVITATFHSRGYSLDAKLQLKCEARTGMTILATHYIINDGITLMPTAVLTFRHFIADSTHQYQKFWGYRQHLIYQQ